MPGFCISYCPYCTTIVSPIPDVVEQTRVIGDKRFARFVRAGSHHDGAKSGKVGARERRWIDNRHVEAELLQHGRDIVTHAVDVRDPHAARDAELDRLDAEGRWAVETLRANVIVLDRRVTRRERLSVTGGDGVQRVPTRRQSPAHSEGYCSHSARRKLHLTLGDVSDEACRQPQRHLDIPLRGRGGTHVNPDRALQRRIGGRVLDVAIERDGDRGCGRDGEVAFAFDRISVSVDNGNARGERHPVDLQLQLNFCRQWTTSFLNAKHPRRKHRAGSWPREPPRL
jgi:hypothetical protein